MNKAKNIVLVYDGDCPVCSRYAKVMRIQATVGDLLLVNAREESAIVEKISARGINLDHGMVLIIKDQFYSGPDALHAFALLGSRSGFINRLNYWLFKSRTRSQFLFPILRCLRNVLLVILRKKRIDDDTLGLHESAEDAMKSEEFLEPYK